MHNFLISSHKGNYSVEFNNLIIISEEFLNLGTHFIIDNNVVALLPSLPKNHVIINATEQTKSYLGIEPIIDKLIKQNLKRSSHLVAIGGGITQDITCFIANNFMRGVKWSFIPTTLLAQADSCIGSKSSINFNNFKNLLGSFTPPERVIISEQFLTTLEPKDIISGIGEIVKLYLIDGKLVDADTIKQNLNTHLFNTLQIKKQFIEVDEFDQGIRNILNYGHCIGHGIEGATNFAIPHGVAVSMGMDAANRFALSKNLITESRFLEMHAVLTSCYQDFSTVEVPIQSVMDNMSHDKKNTGSQINLILPVLSEFKKVGFEPNKSFWQELRDSLVQNPINFIA